MPLPKKIGGLPTPAVIGLGVAAVGVVYYLRKKNAAAAATAATPAGSTVTGAATTPYGPVSSGGGGGDNAALLSILAAQGAGSAGSSATPYTPPTGETVAGSGFGNGGAPITSPSGQTFTGISASEIQPLTAAGQLVYYQPSPGVFSPVGQQPGNTSNPELAWIQQNLAGGTPLYIAQGASA